MSDSTRKLLVAVIGDAGVLADSDSYVLGRSIGEALVTNGYRVLTGGLGGVMEAACRGARESARYTAGDTVGILPGHASDEANDFADIAIPTGQDHLRNSIVAHADAVVAIGGGAGTMTEICFAWIYKRLIIGLRVDGWSGRVADQRIDKRKRYKDEPDDKVFGADSAADVIQILRERLPRYRGQHNGIRRRV